MNFSKITYERIDFDSVKDVYSYSIEKIKGAQDFSIVKNTVKELNILRKHIETMRQVATIRYSMDTVDEVYRAENDFWDENGPIYEDLNYDFYCALLDTDFKEELIKEYGEQFYNLLKCYRDGFSKDIIDLLQEENRLMSEYTSLLASAKIEFDGKICNLSDMSVYMGSRDEKTRRDAVRKHTEFFAENEDKFDEIFDKMVKLRHEMALRMGYKNYIPLGYNRMQRTDYNEEMVKSLRKNIINNYVPKAQNLYIKQAHRIGKEKLSYYDMKLEYPDGNAKLIGDDDYVMKMGARMYSELSDETNTFYDYLMENGLFSVKAAPNKSMGGFCTMLPEFEEPFIFGNFNGTTDDIDLLTHEIGHAFQMYSSRYIDMPELIFPTFEACEIHSMSMEFFTHPWMELFFGDEADRYRECHYDSAIKFLPYGTLVDHFQHEVYAHPQMTKEERKAKWRELEKIYIPCMDYEDLDVLERGAYWFRQGHIFKNPFYYIDYVLAQLCALQFYDKMQENFEEAWEKYLGICKIGGLCSFLEIVKRAGLKNPFECQ